METYPEYTNLNNIDTTNGLKLVTTRGASSEEELKVLKVLKWQIVVK